MSRMTGMFGCLRQTQPSEQEAKQREEIERILESGDDVAPVRVKKAKVGAKKRKTESMADDEKVAIPDLFKKMGLRQTSLLFRATYGQGQMLAQVLAKLGVMSPDYWTLTMGSAGLDVQVTMNGVMVAEVRVPSAAFELYSGLVGDAIVFNMPSKSFATFSTFIERSQSLNFGYNQTGDDGEHMYVLAYPRAGQAARVTHDDSYFKPVAEDPAMMVLGIGMVFEIEIPFKKWATKVGQLRRASDDIGIFLTPDEFGMSAIVEGARREATTTFQRCEATVERVTEDDRDSAFCVVRRIADSDDALAAPFIAGDLIRLSGEYMQRATQIVKTTNCSRVILRIGYRQAGPTIESCPVNMLFPINEGGKEEFTCSIWIAPKSEPGA